MKEILTYYTEHSPLTDPGPYASLYADLPDDHTQLFKIINNVLFHAQMARDLYQPTSSQRREQFLRTMQQRLGRIQSLDPAPLTIPRTMKEKQIGYCRDFAVFMTSILRHKGIPARTRAGFGAYFIRKPPYRGDHWVTEYWNATVGRWQLVDADLGGADLAYLENLSKRPVKPGLDFTDLRPNEDFYLAPYSWMACRSGEIDVKLYRHNGRWYGWPMLRGNLLHDFQALNKLEMNLFDYWDDLHSKPETEITAQDSVLLDRIAVVCHDPDAHFGEMQTLFEELPRTRVIRSRLYLIGVLGDGSANTANDLYPSDLERLQARIAPKAVSPTATQLKRTGGPGTHPPASTPHSLAHRDGITIQGARQNNLKGIDVYIPRQKLVVITGVSGSGKSSLAFDTIYAEGQRRYVESLSSFTRQFMKKMERPQVDKIIGLNPAVAIEQHTFSPNSRSTVGSITEITDYLRVLFARIGQMHCPQCGRSVTPRTAQEIARSLSQLPPGTLFDILAPAQRYSPLTAATLLEKAAAAGISQFRIAGRMVAAEAAAHILRNSQPPTHRSLDEDQDIELVVTNLVVTSLAAPDGPGSNGTPDFYSQLLEALETGLKLGQGVVHILLDNEMLRLSSDHLCPACTLALPKLEPRLLNHNTIFGMCLECSGLGVLLQVDPDRVITRPEISLLDGASPFYGKLRRTTSKYWINYIRGIAAYYDADLERPWVVLPAEFRHTLIHGTGDHTILLEFGAADETGSFNVQRNRPVPGAIHHINRLYRETKSENQRRWYLQFMSQQPCPGCSGEKLNKEARFITLNNTRFPDVTHKNIGELLDWIRDLRANLDERQHKIGEELLAEVEQRLQFIVDVGLHYLSLDRPAPTLSGGEAQRVRLASQIGSELTGVLYILDEPSIGLHSRDHQALLKLLCHLRDAGNTVLVVEHDADTMRTADWLIDMGPGAGIHGGEIVAAGTPAEVAANPDSLTGRYLSGHQQVHLLTSRTPRVPTGWLSIRGARLHNLKRINVDFPLGTFTALTGVSGSGKSSLVIQTLYPALANRLHRTHALPGPFDSLTGTNQIKRVLHITQAPIGRNPRSNPGTYVGALAEIRKLFAATAIARQRGYTAGHFSFNAKGGRCEACEGYGANKVKLHFMADVWVRCPVCEGKRFLPEILDVHYREKSIAEVLELDIAAAQTLFSEAPPKIRNTLQTLVDVGLGYLKLGQSALTLSGGEAQRVKLAKELSRNDHNQTLYILDEPTTGLHFADIERLLVILDRLVAEGNTVIVIEHNLDVIQAADWVIDLGPDGGDAGGKIIAAGPPAKIATNQTSWTGQYLQERLRTDEGAAGKLAGALKTGA